MRNCDLERRFLSETVNPVDTLNQANVDEKGYYNHLKLTNMTRAINNNSGRVYKNVNTVIKKPSLIIEKFNSCMNNGNAFIKGHLNICRAKINNT